MAARGNGQAMLTQIRIQRYKSLYDITVELEPLTVFIGPNGSGKSNLCEAVLVLSHLLRNLPLRDIALNLGNLGNALNSLPSQPQVPLNKFWHGDTSEALVFNFSIGANSESGHHGPIKLYDPDLIPQEQQKTFQVTPSLRESIGRVAVYDFSPAFLMQATPASFESSGQGIANLLSDILFDNRERFNELEARFIQLVPNISRISLKRESGHSLLRLVDRYSEHLIPAADISDGTLRLLGFLAALYQSQTPNILCFEEPENGVHPWLLHKMVELLTLVTTEGIVGKPVQVLITTHSPVLLNYVKPEQVRAVELDKEGKTQIHNLPTDSARFQAAMKAYNNALGELWFSNLFGGNPG
jgi:predicted ATPase